MFKVFFFTLHGAAGTQKVRQRKAYVNQPYKRFQYSFNLAELLFAQLKVSFLIETFKDVYIIRFTVGRYGKRASY